jgi:hypothetical protein
MITGIDYALLIVGCMGLTTIAWQKGWKYFSLLPLLIIFVLSIIFEPSTWRNSAPFYGLMWGIYFCITTALGLFGPKKPILSKSQRKIAELERKIEELSKQKEVSEKTK